MAWTNYNLNHFARHRALDSVISSCLLTKRSRVLLLALPLDFFSGGELFHCMYRLGSQCNFNKFCFSCVVFGGDLYTQLTTGQGRPSSFICDAIFGPNKVPPLQWIDQWVRSNRFLNERGQMEEFGISLPGICLQR